MKTLDYPWDIFVGVSCPNQDARNLAVARDSFASPPRGTSLVLGAIRPSPHAGPLSGSGPAPPGRPARPALNVCLAWTPLSIPKLGGRTRRHRRTKRCRFFHRPWPHWVEQIPRHRPDPRASCPGASCRGARLPAGNTVGLNFDFLKRSKH